MGEQTVLSFRHNCESNMLLSSIQKFLVIFYCNILGVIFHVIFTDLYIYRRLKDIVFKNVKNSESHMVRGGYKRTNCKNVFAVKILKD